MIVLLVKGIIKLFINNKLENKLQSKTWGMIARSRLPQENSLHFYKYVELYKKKLLLIDWEPWNHLLWPFFCLYNQFA